MAPVGTFDFRSELEGLGSSVGVFQADVELDELDGEGLDATFSNEDT